MFFCPLHQFIGQELDLVDVVKADLMKLFRGNLMVKVNHPTPIVGHFSHRLRLFLNKDPLIGKTFGYVFVFCCRVSKPLSKDVPRSKTRIHRRIANMLDEEVGR